MKTALNPQPTMAGKSAPVTIFNDQIGVALSRIPPLWPLSRFVAVNPFVGLSGMGFSEAVPLLKKSTGSSFAMPPSFYREKYRSQLITLDDLKKALNEVESEAGNLNYEPKYTVADLISSLEHEFWEVGKTSQSVLPSAMLDEAKGTRWGCFVVEEISKWCAAYFDEGQSLWSFPWKGMPLFSAWKEAASLDCNPEISGLLGWRGLVRGLPEDPLQVVNEITLKLKTSEQQATDLFHSLLLSIRGWAGHIQFLAHEKQLRGIMDTSLKDLLAIRMVYEAALLEAFANDIALISESYKECYDKTSRLGDMAPHLWQRAHECAMQRLLFDKLVVHGNRDKDIKPLGIPPAFQAVFCIDVRSEIFRRSLETVAPEGQTIGFAGFFGFPIEPVAAGETGGPPQCPVLMSPAARVFENTSLENLEAIGLRKRVKSAWKSFKSSAVSSFVFVEMAGLGFLPRLIRKLRHRSNKSAGSTCGCTFTVDSIAVETQIVMAAGALRHMGLSKGGLARIVFFCGHGSGTENNPYGSSLDCGACGGHTGEANARTAAAILNNPEVRVGLAGMGISIPAETWFLAGLHNTTTDEVTLFDKDSAPATHKQIIDLLEGHLVQAGMLARKERAPLLGINPSNPVLEEDINNRSLDWSQVRPEWGLAGNYAFIAASRQRTRGIDLGGRVFLNDYNYLADEGESTLELVLTAPVVVASWINLQYYASTVDNQRFGSGDKTIHNVASVLGVMEGNGGDIRTGLPLQSVNDGKKWRHEPLRLLVCVEAPKDAINRILKKHPSVADLVSNQWIHLYAINSNTQTFEKSNGRGGWTKEDTLEELMSVP